jgi:hypothetical protein
MARNQEDLRLFADPRECAVRKSVAAGRVVIAATLASVATETNPAVIIYLAAFLTGVLSTADVIHGAEVTAIGVAIAPVADRVATYARHNTFAFAIDGAHLVAPAGNRVAALFFVCAVGIGHTLHAFLCSISVAHQT